ncbi:hypothetical protein OAG68_01715 [bacterium]|nr:hypothetical protein [bacterium]
MTTHSKNTRFKLSRLQFLAAFLVLVGFAFPASVSAQQAQEPTIIFTRISKGFDSDPTESHYLLDGDIKLKCIVTFNDPTPGVQTETFDIEVDGVVQGTVTLSDGDSYTYEGSTPVTADGATFDLVGPGRRPRVYFEGEWDWDSSDPGPVPHNHDPNEHCVNDAGGTCGGKAKVPYVPLCSPDERIVAPIKTVLFSMNGASASGCTSCGGSAVSGSAGSDNLIAVVVSHSPSNQQSIGSLSPGSFLGTDLRIEFYEDNKKNAVLFDPASGKTFYAEFDATSSTYTFKIAAYGVTTDSNTHFIDIALEDSSGNTVTDPTTISTQTVYAILTSSSGWVSKHELNDIDPGTPVFPVSRVVEITSPTGKTQTFTYQYNTGDPALTGAPKKILMIDKITDWQGNTAAFTYKTAQQAGRWVIDTISIVAQGHAGTVTRSLRFTYNVDGYVHQIFRTIGSLAEQTIVTLTYGTDTQWSADYLTLETQLGTAVEEQTLYLASDYRLWENELVNQYTNLLVGAADGAGVRNLVVYRDMDNPGRYRVKQNGDLIEWEAGVSLIACSSYTVGTGQGYDGFTNIQYEPTYQEYSDATGNNPPSAENVLLGQPATISDGTIQSAVEATYDAAGNVSQLDYADSSFEAWQYNSANQVTYYVDREGIVTLTEYNTDGQIIRIVRGLVDVSGPGTEIADTNTTPVQDIFGYNSNGQLEWEATNAYVAGAITAPAANVRTDYVYKANKQLDKKYGPMAPNQSNRPETRFKYEGEQLVEMVVVRASGNETTSYSYDAFGRLIETVFPDSTTEEIAYTSDGLTTYRKDRSNIVSSVVRDSAGRIASRSQALAYDTDLTNVDINGTPATIFERLSDQVSTTTYSYSAGASQPDEMVVDGATTEYIYDYKDRLIETLRFTGHRGSVEQALATKTEYKSNMRFAQESMFGTVASGTFTPAYTRKTYFGYAADGTTVRTVQVASTSTTYADNTAVLNASRPSSTAANPSILITDAIRDLSGNIVSLINPVNTTQLTAYDTLGRSLSQKPDSVNFTNLVSTSEYDVWSNVTKSTNPAGVETTSQYDTSGQYQISQVSGANAASLSMKTEFTYDQSGRRVSVIAPGTNGLPDSNRTTTTHYDATCCSQTIGTEDPLGHGQIRNSDPSGRVVHTAQVADYDTHTTLLNPTDAKTNNETTTRYLDNGQVQFRTLWTQALDENVNRNLPQLAGLGKPASWGVTTQYVYDSSVGDGVGLETTTGVDVLRISTSQNVAVSIAAAITKLGESVASGGADLSLSTHHGKATLVISPDEKTMQASISDAAGRTVMSALLSGPAATTPNQLLDWSCTQHDLVYNLSGTGDVEQTKRIDSDGEVASSLSDGYGWGVASLDQGSNLTEIEFNPGGQPLTVTNALSNDTTYVYDTLGRRTSMTTPAATTTSVYSATTGQLTSRTDGKSKSTSFQYDSLGRPSITTDRLNKLSSRSYYRTGQLASVTDAESRTTSYDYDVMGRRTELTLHAINGGTPQETTYAYDSAGRMERVTLHSGAKREMTYEFSGVLDKVDFYNSSSTLTDTDDFTYDAFLRRTVSSSDDDVTHTYTYTDRGQLDTDTTNYSSQDYVVDYDYDSRGRLNNITYPSGREVDYAFTNRGELDTVDWNGTEIENRAYDALGRMTSVDRAYVDETRVYDNANRVTSIANTNLGTAAYTYDANSNKLGETWTGVLANRSFSTEDSGASDPDGYDDEDRFIRFEQSGQSKDYDLVRSDIGNITNRKLNSASQLRTFNEVHQLDDLAGTSQVFDANGSLTTSHTGMTLSWQHGNGRLDQTVVPSGATAGIEGTNDYGYDAENKRLWKKITRNSSVVEHTVYIYAGPNCIAEYDAGTAASSPEQEYIYGQGIDSLLMIAHDNNTERLNVLRNQQWSVAGLTKDSDGTIAETYSYDVFGKRTILAANGTTVRTASSYNNPFGYTSRRHDEETGLMYYRARYYDPEMGEFVSQDPLGMVDGMSLHRGYMGLSGTDPFGLQGEPVVYIPDRGKFTDARIQVGKEVVNKKEDSKQVRVVFIARWKPDAAKFKDGNCKKCDEIAFLQVAKRHIVAIGRDKLSWERDLNEKFYWYRYYENADPGGGFEGGRYRIDPPGSDHYPHPYPDTMGDYPVTGDPTLGTEIGMGDAPALATYIGATELKTARLEFETCAFCRAGREGPKARVADPRTGRRTLDQLVVYGCTVWTIDVSRDGKRKHTVTPQIISQDASPSNRFLQGITVDGNEIFVK